MATTNEITINKTATYSTYGDPEKADTIIFALHGYGQLVKFFINKFKLLPEKYFVIAPEGFHRFYLKGTTGRVGASWMTKENREKDIEDINEYLDQLWDKFRLKYSFENKILLGFSQGGATASRWHNSGNFNASTFILWAAVFPSDLKLKWQEQFQKSDNFFVIGTEDEYYNEEKIEFQKQYFKDNNVNFKTSVFNGKHEIDFTQLMKIIK